MKNKISIQDMLVTLQQIDYRYVLLIGNSVFIYYTSCVLYKAYSLKKEFRPKITKVELPPELIRKYQKIDMDKIISAEYGSALVKFTKLLIDKFREEDLILFYNNVNELVIKNKNYKLENFILTTSTDGKYNTKKNEITINNNSHFLTIYHELFHMASSFYNEILECSGFNYYNKKLKVGYGHGLNEGYTQTLTERYFGKVEDGVQIYFFESNVAQRLEEIIGQEKMESLYLSANLRGLIDELKKYESEENIMKFICHLDFVNSHFDINKRMSLTKKKMLSESFKYISRFLLICYTKKINNEIKNNCCTNEDGINNIVKFTNKVGSQIHSNKYSFELLNNEDIGEIFKNNLNMDVNINKKR